jgi:curved DNA-binding protein CbpA
MSTESRAHLQVLGLGERAGWHEVQGRYRQLVLAHHPDLHPGDSGAAERFRTIAASYAALAVLQRERPEDQELCLRRMCQDPRLRALDRAELGQRLRHSSSPWVRAAAAFLLGEDAPRGDRAEARGLLRAARLDPQVQVRRAALESLGRIGRPGDLAGYLLRAESRQGLPAAVLLQAAAAIWRRAAASLRGRLAALAGRLAAAGGLGVRR